MKTCPRCAITLASLGATPASRCPGCSGIWIPGSALETGGRGGVGALLAAFSPRSMNEPALACPDCRTETLQALGRSRFRIDRCSRFSGLWVEGALLDQLRTEITPRWKEFLGSMMGPGLAEVIHHLVED